MFNTSPRVLPRVLEINYKTAVPDIDNDVITDTYLEPVATFFFVVYRTNLTSPCTEVHTFYFKLMTLIYSIIETTKQPEYVFFVPFFHSNKIQNVHIV
jgi:hypothetical protein